MRQPLWARPNDNCQLWPKWQVPMCGAILIQTGNCQTGSCHLGPVVHGRLRIQCLNVQLPEWPQLAIASLGPEWPKSAVYNFTENRLFWAQSWSWHHCDVTLGTLVLISVCMERRTPSYTMVEFTCIGRFHFLSSQWEVNHPLELPLEDVLQKRLGKMRVR